MALFNIRKHYRKRWPRLPLWLEITLILIIKLALLFVLWKLFFSTPQTKKMRMPTDLVEQHLLNKPFSKPLSKPSIPATTPSNILSPSLPSEAPHDSN
ncbi:cytochrome oxidase putative small subunit CydP [Glaciimonas sp. GG7]